MKFTAKQIAKILNGKIIGNPKIKVHSLAKIEEGKTGDLCFLANPKYNQFIYSTNASIVIVNKDFNTNKKISATLILVEDAYHSFSQLLEIYNKMRNNKTGIDSHTKIDTTAQIGEDVYVGAFTFISEGVKIGNNVKINPNCYIGEKVSIDDNSILFPGVNIYHECKIGKNSILEW